MGCFGVTTGTIITLASGSYRRGISSECSAVQRCVAGYSIEVTPAAAKKVESFAAVEGLAKGTVVNVTFLPGSDIADTISICERLSQAQMLPVAHVPARSFATLEEVDAYLEALVAVGVREVLVLGGGAPTPAGLLVESLQILRSGLLQKHGVDKVGVAAHPEGHPDIEEAVLMEAIVQKVKWAREAGVELYFETQFCFEPEPIIAWEQHVRSVLKDRLGEDVKMPPVHIGVAGPAKISTLIKFGTMSGVGASLRFVTKYASNVLKLATTSAPDKLVAGLARHQTAEPECLVQKLHFYPFGGMKSTLAWANAVVDGKFTKQDDDDGFTVQ